MVERNIMLDAFGNKVTNVCRIASGTYTGDGATSLAITGLGFHPKLVRIWLHDEAGGDTYVFEKSDQHYTTFDTVWTTVATDEIQTADNQIISLDADGFTVDDAGADAHPNHNGQAYMYLALGIE